MLVRVEDEVVEVKAFRGTRRTAVYRNHVLSGHDFTRLVETGATRELPVLASLDRPRGRQLDKANARRLAAEATDVRMSGELPDLDGDLVAIAEVARWCARATDDSWLEIEAAG